MFSHVSPIKVVKKNAKLLRGDVEVECHEESSYGNDVGPP